MEKIGLFWGSNTGNQEEATNFLTDYMKSEGYEMTFIILQKLLLQKC